MVREAKDMCLRVLKESNKIRFDSFSRYEQCIDHIPYHLSGLSRAHFFRQSFKVDPRLLLKSVSPQPNEQVPTINLVWGKTGYQSFILKTTFLVSSCLLGQLYLFVEDFPASYGKYSILNSSGV